MAQAVSSEPLYLATRAKKIADGHPTSAVFF